MSSQPNIPSNAEILSGMDKEIEKLDRVEHDPSVSYKGERILEDVKRVIKDQEALIQQKNNGEEVQRLLQHGYLMAVDLANDSRFNSLFSSWGSILASVSRSGDWSEITKAAGTLASDLRNTESFLSLLQELQTTIKLLLAQKVDQVTSAAEEGARKLEGGVHTAAQTAQDVGAVKSESKHKAQDAAEKVTERTEDTAEKVREKVHSATGVSESSKPISDERYERAQEKHRKKLLHQLSRTMDAISKNPTWNFILAKSNEAKNKLKEAAERPATDAALAVAEKAQERELAKDCQAVLQSLVGKDVNTEEFFKHSNKLIDAVLNDPDYPELLQKVQNEFQLIADRPKLLEDKHMQENLKNLLGELQAKMESLQNHPELLAAQREGQKIVDAIMNDPLSNKLIKDTRTLITHLQSVQPGHLLDPDLLLQARGLLVPLLLQHLTNVPVPDVHDTADTPLGKYEYTMQNIHADVSELVPDNIHIKFKYDLDAHPVSLSYNRQYALLVLEARDIQLHLKDVEWTYNRLTLPHMHDAGRVNVDTEGHGLNVRIKMKINRVGETHTNAVGQTVEQKDMLTVVDSNVWIDKWKFHFADSKHDKLYEMLTGLYSNRIKRGVIERLKEKMVEFASDFNSKVYMLINEATIKQHEAQYVIEAKKAEAYKSWKQAKRDAKYALLESAPAQAVKEAGKEALATGLERARDAPSVGAAVSDFGHQLKENLKDTASDAKDDAKDVKDAVKGAAKEKKDDAKAAVKQTTTPSM